LLAATASAGGKVVYTKEEIDRFNRAAEAYFREKTARDPSSLLNKPLSGFVEPPLLLYRFGVLLASLDIGCHTVLDFGAGTCWVSSILNRMGCRTIALDVSETALRCGRQMFELDKRHKMDLSPQFIVYDGYAFPLSDQSVDRIICFDAFHHVPNKQDILKEMYRVLKVGGNVAFSEPGLEHSHSTEAISEMETYEILESDIDLDEFVRLGEAVGFSQIYIKPYPPPNSIKFHVEEYRRFIRGEDNIFPIDVIRHDLKHNTNIIFHKGENIPDSKRPNVLHAHLTMLDETPMKVNADARYVFRLEIKNRGDTVWLATPNSLGGFVTLGAHLYGARHSLLNWDYGRGKLARDVHPGEEQTVTISLTAPSKEGIYYIEFDMSCEMISWFAHCGSKTLKARLEVV
jgi:SAM-dependent methyltransferase